ncbi:MAG: ATPase, T2SS/T4P/T4SS family [Verrucomicrobiota bacterium]
MAGELHLHITDPRNVQKVVRLDPGTYTMGSDDENQILLQDSTISWRHAVLSHGEAGVFIEDLKSVTGTYLDGHRVKDRQQVRSGQRIQIGGYVLMLEDPDAPAPSPAAEAVASPAPAFQAPVDTGMPSTPPAKAPDLSGPAPRKKSAADLRRLEQKRVIKKQIHEELLERLDLKRLTVAQAGTADLSKRARDIIEQIVADVEDRLPEGYKSDALAKEVFDEALGLGPLTDFLDDPEVTEIMVNGYNQIYIEQAGKLSLTDMSFVDEASVNSIIERIVAPIGRRIDESQPYVDARLPDGSRVNAIIPPLSLIGPVITIRKFSRDPFTVEQLIEMGSVNPAMVRFIDACVKVRKNIIISGGTGTGKTTFLNVVSSFIPEEERIVTIEDAAELRLTQDHVVKLEARPPNIEGKGAITIRDLVRNSLRMRPDRIVIGECRGGEALDMLQAMNTGHEGSLTTIHANSPRDAMARLETLVLMAGMELPLRAIREQIGSAIQVVIQLSRYVDGTRKVSYVTEICGMEGDKLVMQDLFEFKQTGYDADNKVIGHLQPTGNVPTFLNEFQVRQIPIDVNIFNPGEG